MIAKAQKDRRYQIFISSTFKDLETQRKQAVQVIVERGHIPIALERFSAKHESDLEVIEKVISQCQIYLLILGHRYGELVPQESTELYGDLIPPGEQISYTHLEYNLAVKHKLMVLALQMHPDEIRTRRADLKSIVEADHKEQFNEERLDKFHKHIAKHHRQFWKTESHDFKAEILAALVDNLKECEERGLRGFIPEPEDPTILDAAANEFIVDLVNELRGFETLYSRVSQEAAKKRALALCFRQNYGNRIVRDKTSLFFESGSTVAYVAKDLANTLASEVRINEDGAPTIKINTNNVLAYLLLWLKMRVICSPFPWSTPTEKKFGAWYGGLEDKEPLPPDYELPPLNDEARREIEKLLAHPYRPGANRERCLLLGATSGLQLGKEHKLRFKDELDDEAREVLRNQISKCFGPHVGSYHNKVFKRFMYDTKLPIMFFLTADKIDSEIDVGRCHFILDREFSWERFYTDYPLAFCIGCSQDEKRSKIKLFQDIGFKIRGGNMGDQITAFIARNDVFIRQFEENAPLARSAAAGKMTP